MCELEEGEPEARRQQEALPGPHNPEGGAVMPAQTGPSPART